MESSVRSESVIIKLGKAQYDQGIDDAYNEGINQYNNGLNQYNVGIEQYNQSVVQLQYLIENNLITPEDAAIMQEKLNETKIQTGCN